MSGWRESRGKGNETSYYLGADVDPAAEEDEDEEDMAGAADAERE
jgi:hypothetical protein